jgi:hypothetical protein
MSARHRQTVLDYAKRQALPHAERMVLCQIADYIRRDDLISFPGVRRLADDLGYTERYIQKILRRLERAGLLLAASFVGGRGHRTGYRIPGLEEGEVRPEAIEQPPVTVAASQNAEKTPEEELSFARHMAKRRNLTPARRTYWEARIAELERQLAQQDFDPRLEYVLEPVEPDEALLELEAFYVGLISLQAAEQDESKRAWWQLRIDRARADYNQALEERGIVAADGLSPAIDEELEEQLREEQIMQWRARVADLTSRRDTFSPGSERWNKWNRITVEASENLNGLLYQKPPPLIESPATT